MPVLAGYDPNPSDNVRVEIAFTTGPDDPNPAWEDCTSSASLAVGIGITRGRLDEYSAIQSSSSNVTLENIGGAFTAGNPSSPHYPYVKPYRKIRYGYRAPGTIGNFVDEASASFESGVGAWTALGAASIAQDTLHAVDGSKSLKITWAVTASISKATVVIARPLVIGRTYRLSCVSFVPTGGEVVSLNIDGIGLGVSSTLTNAPETLSTTFTATSTSHSINVYQFSVGTGYSSWIDAVRVDEVGTPTTFTTDAPPISYRFTGHVEEFPVEWPTGGQEYAVATLTCTDRFGRLGAKNLMRSVIEEAVNYSSPVAYYPMGEPTGATKAGDIAATAGVSPLSIAQFGAGGVLDFGTATGPPTDALPAPTFTPVSVSNGKYLTGLIPGTGAFSSMSLRASFLTSTTARQCITRIRDAYGSYLELEVTAGGFLRGHLWSVFSGDTFTITSAARVDNGLTHDAVLTVAIVSGTTTATLYLDGASAGSASYSAVSVPLFTTARVGGTSEGACFNGTICHVAVFNSALSATAVADQYTATSTGYEGERSDQRIQRYARWAGIADSEMLLDVGSSTSICFTDTTGQSVLQAMQDVAITEGGRLFIDGAGRLVFHNRARGYANPAAVASVTNELLDPSAKFVESTQGLINDLTAARPTGPSIRAVDQASVVEFGVHDPGALTLLVTSDQEVTDAVNWRVLGSSTPHLVLPQGTFDMFTDTTGYQAQLRALELGDRITVSNLPSQAGPSTVDLIVEGYTERIGIGEWSLQANLSSYSTTTAWVWDVSTWDDGSCWIY